MFEDAPQTISARVHEAMLADKPQEVVIDDATDMLSTIAWAVKRYLRGTLRPGRQAKKEAA